MSDIQFDQHPLLSILNSIYGISPKILRRILQFLRKKKLKVMKCIQGAQFSCDKGEIKLTTLNHGFSGCAFKTLGVSFNISCKAGFQAGGQQKHGRLICTTLLPCQYQCAQRTQNSGFQQCFEKHTSTNITDFSSVIIVLTERLANGHSL